MSDQWLERVEELDPEFKKEREAALGKRLKQELGGISPQIKDQLRKEIQQESNEQGKIDYLSMAARGGEELDKLLTSVGVDARDCSGKTLLMYAAEHIGKFMKLDGKFIKVEGGRVIELNEKPVLEPDKQVVQQLIAKDAKVNARDKRGNTALMYAAANENEGAVRQLLAAGAKVDVRNNDGETALMKALDRRNFDKRPTEKVVRLLLEAGATVHLKDNREQTALTLAAQNQYVGVMRLLIDNRAQVNAQDWEGRTPLMNALLERGYGNRLEAIRLLLDSKAAVDAQAIGGSTALMEAAELGDEAAVRLLLEAKANVRIKDEDGLTVLNLLEQARPEGYEHIAQLLGGAQKAPVPAPGPAPVPVSPVPASVPAPVPAQYLNKNKNEGPLEGKERESEGRQRQLEAIEGRAGRAKDPLPQSDQGGKSFGR